MKYAIIIPDGCADEILDNEPTPLAAAATPHMDRIAAAGIVGRTNNVPAGYTPGSEVANMTLLGYDPHVYFTGRAPIEAAAQQIALGPCDWAIRCNLVTIVDQTMIDFTAGHISTEEATEILAAAQAELADDGWQFQPGVSYRNLLIYRGREDVTIFTDETRTTAPHDLTDLTVGDDFPRGPGSDRLSDLMDRSVALLAKHPVNAARHQQGKRTASHLWLWGLGRGLQLPTFHSLYGLSGAMITAVDLLRGLAAAIDWTNIAVPGATGYLDTDYAAKGRSAVEALDEYDVVCVHIEAPDEASHEGRRDAKIEAIEQIDRHIVGPVYDKLRQSGDHRIWVLPDHRTLLRTKKHEGGDVPMAIAGTGIAPDAAQHYSESVAAESATAFARGWEVMPQFIRGDLNYSDRDA